MSKKIIERDLRKDYGQVFVKFGEVEHITVEDAIQILDDFLNQRNIQKTEHWKELVEKYYTFYQEKFGMKPDFARQNTKTFKEIIEKVKRSTEQKGVDWTLENAVRELDYILVSAYEDKWLKKNYLLKNINAQFQKLRDIRHKEVMYFGEMLGVYKKFYQEKFGKEPDLNDWETENIQHIVEKLNKSATQNGVSWTKINAEKYLIKLLGLAYEDKWLKKNYLLKNINTQFQKLRDIRHKEVMYFDEMKEAYKVFYKERFGKEPDLNEWETEDLRQIVEKLRNTAEQNKVAWTKINAEKYLIKVLRLAYDDKWLKENYLLKNINTQFQKLRDIRPKKEVMYFDEMKELYKKFYKEKFGLEPDLNEKETEDLRQIVEKLRNTAEQNKVTWTQVYAEKYLIKLLGLAYEDKWIKNHFLLLNINKHFQQLRDNDRARKGDKTGGRVSDKAVSDFINKRKAHTNSQTDS